MAKQKQDKKESDSNNNKPQLPQNAVVADRNYRVSKFAHTKLKISLFFDGIFENVSTPVVHIALLVINIILALMLFFGLLFYQPGDMTVDDIGSSDFVIDEIENDVVSIEKLESAVKSATIQVENAKKPEFPFKKSNEWGEIKPLDDKWWNKTLFDAYVFLLDELKFSDRTNTRKVLESLHKDMKTFFNASPDSNSSRFLVNFFREHLLLRSYADAETSNPAEIVTNLGGNEYDVVFLVLATLSKIGVSSELGQIEHNEKSALILQLKDNEYFLQFSQREFQGEHRKIKVIEFIENFIRFHISTTVGKLKLVKLYELLENLLNPSVEIYRELCKLYLELEKITEEKILKKKYRDKSLYYRSKLPNDNPEDLFLLAKSEFDDGNTQESWDKFIKLVENFPHYLPETGESQYYYLAQIGSIKFEAGAIEAQKLNGFLTHLEYDIDKHRKVLSNSAYLFFERKQYDFSLKILNNLEKRGFADVRLYLTRSKIYIALKKDMPSISNLKAAIKLDVENRKLRAQLIQMLLQNKLYMEAYNECEKAADSAAKMIFALKIGVAIAEEYLNDLSLAEKMLAKYVQLNPNDLEAREKLESYLN
ncbi:MAG: hypothetical protein K8S87_06950 [Planctomycetes bacterium]|nr:hypothetical protein [Planctomycetota bacterium]